MPFGTWDLYSCRILSRGFDHAALTVCKPTANNAISSVPNPAIQKVVIDTGHRHVDFNLLPISERFMYTSEQKYFSSLILNMEKDLPNSQSF